VRSEGVQKERGEGGEHARKRGGYICGRSAMEIPGGDRKGGEGLRGERPSMSKVGSYDIKSKMTNSKM